MKFPTTTSTFAWLTAAVGCAALLLFLATSVLYPRVLHAADAEETLLPLENTATLARSQAPAANLYSSLLPPENTATLKSEPMLPSCSSDNLIQLAFLLDTSGSMDGLIDQAKSRLWSILNEIIAARRNGQAPHVQVALYEYGNDRIDLKQGYIRQVVSLTTDVDDLSEKLFALTTDGGQEYCGLAIQHSLNELEWSDDPNTIKLIYIAGNESFTQGSTDPYATIDQARQRDIVVNTIFCGAPEQGRVLGWYTGATRGAGEYFHIDQNEASVYVPSPYDDRIEAANLRLNGTYIPLGQQGQLAIQKQTTQDANAASYSKANLASRAKYKASSSYSNAHWDLVDAYDEDKKAIQQKDALPDSLKNLSETELIQQITTKKADRNALQAEIQELNQLRDQYVAEEQKKSANTPTNTLGDKISASVKKRLAEKGYTVEN